jgi:hypothetical protein
MRPPDFRPSDTAPATHPTIVPFAFRETRVYKDANVRGSRGKNREPLFVFVREHMMDLSTLIGAVRPKDRTDQYLVLAALYTLGAHTTPVPAKQVIDLLKLHLGTKIPANVNDSLRKYKAYVSPQKGPPLRWSLTQGESSACGISAA